MEYLSDSWFAAASDALRHAEPAPAQLVIDQYIDDGPSWRVTTGPDATVVQLTDEQSPRPADATFRQSYTTACGVAAGTIDAHQALLLGAIRFEGEVEALIEARPALDWLHAVLEPVMAATTVTTMGDNPTGSPSESEHQPKS